MEITTEFKKELEDLINRYCIENGSDTPDFILANYLVGCVENFNFAVSAREVWYGRMVEPEPPKD